MKYLQFLFILSSFIACSQQTITKEQQVQLDAAKDTQYKLNLEYADKEESPLMDKDFEEFRSLDFFPVDLKYIIKASFEKNEFPVPFELATTTDRKPVYQKYGTLFFELDGVKCELPVYQNVSFIDHKNKEYRKHLFVPFTDLTNGSESYGGGRYVDLELPLDPEVIIDFNRAYNPYCAYNHKYSCVIPPKENDLKVAIKAGVKAFH
jgi:uncharacterized protein (DUF1684 family)